MKRTQEEWNRLFDEFKQHLSYYVPKSYDAVKYDGVTGFGIKPKDDDARYTIYQGMLEKIVDFCRGRDGLNFWVSVKNNKNWEIWIS